MNTIGNQSYVEFAYGAALELVATGETYETTRGILIDQWPGLSIAEVDDILADALRDALKQGIEREDIDPSWL